jgi:hypothetical protein
MRRVFKEKKSFTKSIPWTNSPNEIGTLHLAHPIRNHVITSQCI